MSDKSDFGFAKFVPGFDFLQNLAKGASQAMPQMPTLSNWIAPTLNVDELERRISELKAVHFWLDQNGKALSATIQALEVQKMTLATLHGMNVRMTDLADALKAKPSAARPTCPAAPADSGAGAEASEASSGKGQDSAGSKSGNGAASPVDPLQWWGALTQQFQQIAASAMKDVAQQAGTGTESAAGMAGDVAKQAMKTATDMAQAATSMGRATTRTRSAAPAPAAAKKPAPRKAAARKKAAPAR